MAIGDFDTFYADNPWEGMDKNQRRWYDPDLVTMFRQRSVFSPMVQFTQNLGAVAAKTMQITHLLDPHPDFTQLGLRQIWMPASHVDSRAVEITFYHYGGKVAYHEYDDLVTYWRLNGQRGIRRIMNGALGQHMVDVMDYLARNAYVQGALDTGFVLYPDGAEDFGDIEVTDKFDINVAMDIWLGMANRGVPSALGVNGASDSIYCVTTPGVIYDIQSAEDWISIREYSNQGPALRYEVGAYKNVRFIQSPRATLWNCGALIAQAPVTAAITAGDGAPDPALGQAGKVDGTYMVGNDGVRHYLQLGDFGTGTLGDLDVNDILTIHTTRTLAYGTANGVDFNEGKAVNRRLVAKDADTGRIQLDLPIMLDMDTPLGGGAYAYVTKARHVHSSIFVAAPNGIVSGVSRAPRFHTPPPVDDFESIYRFSWNGYFGYQVYAPEVFEVVFSAGSTRIKGPTAVQ